MIIHKIIQTHQKEIILILCAMLIATFLNFYKSTEVPACLNSDEVAFGYNAYSVLKTGRDEFGQFFPIRFKSFNDYKLPLYSYLSIPFIQAFGLNDFSTRLLNKVVGILLVPSTYFVALYLFKRKKIALLATYLVALSPWIYIISRHAHEGVLLVFFLLWGLYFTMKHHDKARLVDLLLADGALILASHSYHLGRFFVAVFLLYQFGVLIWKPLSKLRMHKRAIIQWLLASVILIGATFGIDATFGAPRVSSLLFFHNQGFTLDLDEKIREDGNIILHNDISQGVIDISKRYFDQITPEFFVLSGDKNPRFGFSGIGLITPIEYLFVFIGLYFLYKNKHPYRILLTLLLVVSPLANALTWQDRSIIRTYFMIFPIVLIAAYGLFSFVQNFRKLKLFVIGGLLIFYGFFLVQSWDMYLFHYYKRPIVAQAWQCGYKELADYVRSHYDRTQKFYITKKHGQPYIYLLFYNKIPPKVFQNSLQLTSADEFGFTQVRAFDKYQFDMFGPFNKSNTIYIGYPDDFDATADPNKITKIKFGIEEMFWIVDNTSTNK